jgi:hypothetical protein
MTGRRALGAVQPVAVEPTASAELEQLARLAGGLRINWQHAEKFFELRSDLAWRLRRAARRVALMERLDAD